MCKHNAAHQRDGAFKLMPSFSYVHDLEAFHIIEGSFWDSHDFVSTKKSEI